MRKSPILLTAAIAAVALFSQPAHADQFMNINFGGDTIGSAPGTSPSAIPDLQPQAIGGYLTDADPDPGENPPSPLSGTIVVGNASGMSQGAILTTTSTAQANGQLYIDTGFAVHSQTVQLSFDLNVLDGKANQTDQPKTLNGSGATAILFGLNAFTSDVASGQQSFRFAVAPTSDTGGVLTMRSPNGTNLVSFFNYTVGETNHVEIDADYTTGTLDTFVNGNPGLTNFSFLTAGSLANATTQEFFMFLNGQLGDTNQVAIDNISGVTTPEPASLGLLGAGALALIAKRRRTR